MYIIIIIGRRFSCNVELIKIENISDKIADELHRDRILAKSTHEQKTNALKPYIYSCRSYSVALKQTV